MNQINTFFLANCRKFRPVNNNTILKKNLVVLFIKLLGRWFEAKYTSLHYLKNQGTLNKTLLNVNFIIPIFIV